MIKAFHGSFLTGKYRKDQPSSKGARTEGNNRMQGYMNDRNWALLDQLETIAQALSKTIAAMALAWINAAPAVSAAIVGANSVDQGKVI